MHAHKRVHLDVKSDNVLLTRQRKAKLSDFGSSKEMRSTYRDTLVRVTRQWSAPETLAAMSIISAPSDVWSFGMLIYEMATGKVPYAELPEMEMLKSVANGETQSTAGIERRLVEVM